jgi:hypothetical protein
MRTPGFLFAFLLVALFPVLTGCPAKDQLKPVDGKVNQPVLGRLMFDAPVAFAEVGSLDLPRLTPILGGETQLLYLKSEGQNQRVMYAHTEGDGFTSPGALSQDEGPRACS